MHLIAKKIEDNAVARMPKNWEGKALLELEKRDRREIYHTPTWDLWCKTWKEEAEKLKQQFTEEKLYSSVKIVDFLIKGE